ncbi:M48 family metallopeptidase [Halopiger djelfimassiliensis]|uniref:M48 family metallopeptidase n=1 Tax=Halopiger djelfimassiliensis TaxID=1293047 RepID=UPI000677D61E|nr:M48 family metalloprotease [Halopiger djelfimassiliensis]
MSLPLRARLIGTLVVVVLVAVAALATVGWAVHAAAVSIGVRPSFSLPLAAGIVTLAATGLVLTAVRYGYRRSLASIDACPLADDTHALEDRIRRLALAAGVETPTVAIADATEPTSFTVHNGTEATVVVTTGALEILSEDELDAVLAHEVAHLRNRDVAVATIVAAIGSLTEGLFARERRLGQWLQFCLTIGSVTLVLVLVAGPVVVLALVLVLVSVLARTVLAITAVCIVLHARTREYAADRAGAELVGDPAALASALETLEERGPPTADARRLHASSTLGIVPHTLEDRDDRPPAESAIARWVPDGESELDRARAVSTLSRLFGRVGHVLQWRPATHPPTAKRIGRLRRMVDDQRPRS